MLNETEKRVFGADAKLHPVTKMPLEQGSGALPEDQQALIHLGIIAREQGQEEADFVHKKLETHIKAQAARRDADLQKRLREAGLTDAR